jgi:hypothetical protein
MEEVKSKNIGFYIAIFNYIKQGKSPSFISKELKLPRQNIHYYTKILLDNGIIGKKKNGQWFPLVKELSLGTKPQSNLHALNINIPILSGEIKESNWEVKEELNNWIPTYKTFKELGGLTIKNNNNKSITIFAHTRDIIDLKEIDVLSYDIRNWANKTFRQDFNVVLDINKAEVKVLHIATQDKQSESMIKKGEKFELDLDKKAEKVFPNDKIDAKAWIDGSPFQFTAETNDKEWKRAYLNMPFNMQNTMLAMNYIAKNYASHVGIVEKLNNLLEEPKVKKHIKKKLNTSQTTLNNY